MALPLTVLAKALTRRAALDDVLVTLTLARHALRVLRLVARDPAERGITDALAKAVAEGETRFGQL